MRPLKIKDRCTKKKLKKCGEVAGTYDKIQTACLASAFQVDDALMAIGNGGSSILPASRAGRIIGKF
jgi:hypothetical protein